MSENKKSDDLSVDDIIKDVMKLIETKQMKKYM